MVSSDGAFGANLKRLRQNRKLSQRAIGTSVNVAQTTISNAEKGGEISTATLYTLDEIARYFRMPPWMLLLDELPDDEGAWKTLEELVRTFMVCSKENKARLIDRAREIWRLEQLERMAAIAKETK